MKLKNKLLPFIGIAATAATVAPLALTSCGTKNNSNGWLDFVKYRYNPTIEKLPTQALTKDKAVEAYFGDEENFDGETAAIRFYQDFVWSASRSIQANISSTVTGEVEDREETKLEAAAAAEAKPKVITNTSAINLASNSSNILGASSTKKYSGITSYKMKISHINVDQATVYTVEGSTPVKFPIVSYQVDYDYSSIRGYSSDSNITYQYNGTLKIKNLPITLYYDEINYGSFSFYAWNVCGNEELLLDTEKINSEGSRTYTGEIKFSYEDNINCTETVTTNNQSITTSTSEKMSFASGSFTTQEGLEEFLYGGYNFDSGCPNYCSYYMLSASEKSE